MVSNPVMQVQRIQAPKSGIAIQSSTPLYTPKHHNQSTSPNKEHNHEHNSINEKNSLLDASQVRNIPNVIQSINQQHSSQNQINEKDEHQESLSNLDQNQVYVHRNPNHSCSHNHNLGHNHNHNHDHNHHSHPPIDSFAPVFTRPLPSWFQLFSHLNPAQKTIFTWFIVHIGIGIWLYCMGSSRESLSLVGFAYLMIFDALGVLNSFVSSILRTNPVFGISNTKRPYGAHRYEVVFALGTTIYLMFATMHSTKELLEHFLLQDHHSGQVQESTEGHHAHLTLGMFFLIGSGITATFLSSITLRNHDNFVRYLRRRPTTVHGFSYNVINRARGNPIHTLLSNIYSCLIVLCGSVTLIVHMFGIATPFTDKLLALSESIVMFYLGYPTSKALAKVLLQTTPYTVQNGVENRLREVLQDPNIIHVNRVHFWQTTYGKCVGTIEIQVVPEADEQRVLQLVYQKLEGLTSSTSTNGSTNDDSELTVSILK